MTRTRITIEIETELLKQLETARTGSRTVEQEIVDRLAATADYELFGAPLFLNDAQHRRLREISGIAAIGGTEALLDRLAAHSALTLDGMPRVEIPAKWRERLASRAKAEGVTLGDLTARYASDGIRERIGL